MKAVEIASKAADLVGGQRDRQHGAKRQNFENIAQLWRAWLGLRFPQVDFSSLDGKDIGIMMAMLKMARILTGDHNIDDYIDACGYQACSGEIAEEQYSERQTCKVASKAQSCSTSVEMTKLSETPLLEPHWFSRSATEHMD